MLWELALMDLDDVELWQRDRKIARLDAKE
jgi:hypothetical protein